MTMLTKGQTRRSDLFAKRHVDQSSKRFDYSLDYKNLDLRKSPEFYRVGRSEEGVLTVEPYKSEILPLWKFRNPELAASSASSIFAMFKSYKSQQDFDGMDMCRKYLQMGFTRSRRYANHAWMLAEDDLVYSMMKQLWKVNFG